METFVGAEGAPRREESLPDDSSNSEEIFPGDYNSSGLESGLGSIPNNNNNRVHLVFIVLSLLPIAIGAAVLRFGAMHLWSLDRAGVGTCTLPALADKGGAFPCEAAERNWSHHTDRDSFIVPIAKNAVFKSSSHQETTETTKSCNFVVIGNEDQYGSGKLSWCQDWHETNAGTTIECWCCGDNLEDAAFYHLYFDNYATEYPGDYCLPEPPGTWATIGAWVLFVVGVGLIVCGSCCEAGLVFLVVRNKLCGGERTQVENNNNILPRHHHHHPELDGFRESLRTQDVLEEIARESSVSIATNNNNNNNNHRRSAPIFTQPWLMSRIDRIEASLDAMVLTKGASVAAQLSILPMYAGRNNNNNNGTEMKNGDENEHGGDDNPNNAGDGNDGEGAGKSTPRIDTGSIHTKQQHRNNYYNNATTKVDDCCPICLEEYKIGDIVCWSRAEDCNHIFHRSCITRWLKNHNDCPFCRYAIVDSS